MKFQLIFKNILDNFPKKEKENEYLMFKTEIEKSGLFFSYIEKVNLDLLNKINISISELNNTIEYYGNAQLNILNNMNQNLIHLNNKTENVNLNLNKVIKSLKELNNNSSATNMWVAFSFIQDYRRNKI